MKISGFTMVRNAQKYYFPIKESIASALPLVDEFIVALGSSDPDDDTRGLIESLKDPRIKIIDRNWDEKDFRDGLIFAKETQFALDRCSGDWCLYLQADEVLHEQDHAEINKQALAALGHPRIEGLLFKYHHFWGDYDHYLPFHGWYRNEIRMVRNGLGIRSWKDAQSFRHGNGDLLRVREINAYVYHYGWVRPPELMQQKKKEQDSMHHGREKTGLAYQKKSSYFDFGALGALPRFTQSHPKVMHPFMEKLSWKNQLCYDRKKVLNRPPAKHEKFKYRFLTWLENTFNGGRTLFGYRNWIRLP